MTCSLRHKKRIPFTQVYDQTVTDQRLTANAFRVLCYMLGQPDWWQFNCTDIRKKVGLGKEALASAMKCLEKAAYLKRTKEQAANGKFNWTYEIDPTPTMDGSAGHGQPAKNEETIDGLPMHGSPRPIVRTKSNKNIYESAQKTNPANNQDQALGESGDLFEDEQQPEQPLPEVNAMDLLARYSRKMRGGSREEVLGALDGWLADHGLQAIESVFASLKKAQYINNINDMFEAEADKDQVTTDKDGNTVIPTHWTIADMRANGVI